MALLRRLIPSAESLPPAPACFCASYCVGGLGQLCPPGRYGDVFGQFDPLCTANCTSGYFCGPGSTSRTQAPCSPSAEFFCPEVCA